MLVGKEPGGFGDYFATATEISTDLTPHDNNLFPSGFSSVKSPWDLVTTLPPLQRFHVT